MKQYVGRPESDDRAHVGQVFVTEEGKLRYRLDPRWDLRNHSPDGFGWSYCGSGPAQLALAILADATGDDTIAQLYYQDFKADKIATLSHGPWQMTVAEVRAWLDEQRAPYQEEE